MDRLEEKTLEEILELEDKIIEEQYYNVIASFSASRIAKQVIDNYKGESVKFIWEKIIEEEQKNTSSIFFPGDLVLFYPSIKEQRTKEAITCDYSGAIIYPGSLYVNYRPLLENISTKECFVLKRTIKVEPAYYHELPTSIIEFESLQTRMQLESDYDGTGIDYSHFNQRMGGDLVLQKLKRR